MNRNSFFLIGLIFILLISGCKKESGVVTFTLKADNYQSQEKTHMEYANGVYYTCWNDGDEIMINGNTAAVSDGSATISVAQDASQNYYAIYPASCVEGTAVTSSTLITLPSVYEYTTDISGKQIIGAPMAAKAINDGNGQVLFFKNLCTLLKIKVASNITVYNINIHSTITPLSGIATVTIEGQQSDIINMSAVSGEKHVNLIFPQGDATGSGKEYYIPVPPLPSGETLHVSVWAKINNSGKKNIYLRSTTTSGPLPSNLVIPMNIFPSMGSYLIATGVTYLGGNITGGKRPYFDTRIKANQNTTIVTSLVPERDNGAHIASSGSQFIYGINVGSSTPGMFYMWNKPSTSSNTTDLVQFGLHRVTPDNDIFPCDNSNRIVLTQTPSYIGLKEYPFAPSNILTQSYSPSDAFNTTSTIWAFGANGDSQRRYLGKCHYFRIYDNKGVRFYGIPVTVKKDDWDDKLVNRNLSHGNTVSGGLVPCFYDLVTGEFFSSEENGVHFKYGPEINNSNPSFDYASDKNNNYTE
jgi:hypothetical protein